MGQAAPKPLRMCVRCRRLTEDPIVVCEVHTNSGPGWNVYACRSCAPGVPIGPDPMEIMDVADRRRREEQGR